MAVKCDALLDRWRTPAAGAHQMLLLLLGTAEAELLQPQQQHSFQANVSDLAA
jgi:hypothetical protein